MQFDDIKRAKLHLVERGKEVSEGVGEARRRLKETEKELNLKNQTQQLQLQEERNVLNQEKVKYRATLSTLRLQHTNEMNQQTLTLNQRERSLKQMELEMKIKLKKDIELQVVERTNELNSREKTINEQLRELREWEASLLYPSSKTKEGDTISVSSSYDQNIQGKYLSKGAAREGAAREWSSTRMEQHANGAL